MASVAAVLLLLLVVAQRSLAQQQQPEDAGGCNGILVTYTPEGRDKIRPFVPNDDRDSQPYAFRANATVRNSGTHPLRSWALLLTFVHGEILVSVDGAVLTSGADLPYSTSTANGTATSLTGYPQTDLLTPIATAGDLAKIQATVGIVGTVFAGPEPFEPLPSAVSLADPSYACPPATNNSRSLTTCCVSAGSNNNNATDDEQARRRVVAGDQLVITYDVMQAYESTYLALVTLDNGAPLARLDGWQLSWEWQRREFIRSAFQMEVYKMPPDLNRSTLHPPASFKVRGSSPLNPDYACVQPVPVTPSEFPDPSGLASTTLAVASWQAVCNITTPSSPPSCCVSFSAFYNESVVPCRTCACGCPKPAVSAAASCSTTAPAMLMPSERRGKEAVSWADQKGLGDQHQRRRLPGAGQAAVRPILHQEDDEHRRRQRRRLPGQGLLQRRRVRHAAQDPKPRDKDDHRPLVARCLGSALPALALMFASFCLLPWYRIHSSDT
ncbi:hypothetical protein HU200_045578 [Digitaria exilis]|uniref:COBRA C-terminal domain-containing protein n=1 Tax=Digitaria exilis TaxID=1010633 RepID=A0A835ED82_9POAL|nr:hypothetical protein HU200_045578 [Digitaria exilis]